MFVYIHLEQLENNLEMFNEQWNRLSGEIDGNCCWPLKFGKVIFVVVVFKSPIILLEILENLLKREEFENNIKQINLKVKDVEQHVESVQREIRNLNDKLVEKEKGLHNV